MTLLVAFLLLLPPSAGRPHLSDHCAPTTAGRLVPTDFVGGRVFALWNVKGHEALRLYTDTGGGLISLYPDAARRVGARVDTMRWTRGSMHGETILARIPVGNGDPSFPPMPIKDSTSTIFLIQDEPPPTEEPGYEWDGRLGASWFAGGVWTFDYAGKHLYYNGAAPAGPTDAACWVSLGFQRDSASGRTNVFPRIPAVIAGDTIQFLLDTGARTEVTTSAWSAVDSAIPRHRATSFITATRFEQWRARHPDWTVVSHAEVGADSSAMIRVPEVMVGGMTIGPVWFTERPDRSFTQILSPVMDRPIEGALGGSAWKYVTLIVDYPRSRAAVLAPMSD